MAHKVDWKAIRDIAATIYSTEVCEIEPDGLEKLKAIFTEAGFRQLGAGRHRLAFLAPSGRNVVKVPLSDWGAMDNTTEALYWRERDQGTVPLARCRIFCDGLLLAMEAVDTLSTWTYDDLPWAIQIDCAQVGRNRRGQFVAYDYAE
jgi:hypothetical protein